MGGENLFSSSKKKFKIKKNEVIMEPEMQTEPETHKDASQQHGFIFEQIIRTNVFGLPGTSKGKPHDIVIEEDSYCGSVKSGELKWRYQKDKTKKRERILVPQSIT